MTDKPNIGTVSVSREDLAVLIEPAGKKERISIRRHEVMFKLRAILAQPSCATPAGSACPGDGVGRCKACPVTDEPQDEPVGEIVTFAQILSDVSWRDGKMPALRTKLYLRPAAQAVKEDEERAKFEIALQAPDECEWDHELSQYLDSRYPDEGGGEYQAQWEGWMARAKLNGIKP